jgi:hypothetical protein
VRDASREVTDRLHLLRLAELRLELGRARRLPLGQYILSGVEEPRFTEILARMIDDAQGRRIGDALAPIVA